MRALLISAALLVGAGLYWHYRHVEPPDITEDEAQRRAKDALEDFCLSEKSVCADFTAVPQQEPTDKRFRWAFPFINARVDPWRKVVVSVGVKGALSVQFSMMPADAGTAAALGLPLLPAAPAPAPAPEAAAEAPPAR